MTNPDTCWHNLVKVAADDHGCPCFYCVNCDREASAEILNNRYVYDERDGVYVSHGRTSWD